jgi:DNA-directed RNA polymerase specialized sigma24 family protein
MNDTLYFPDEPPHCPPPEWQRAVRIALTRFHRHFTPACPDLNEWRHDCEQEAWIAILKSAPRYRCPDPPPANPEAHYVLWLAGKALKQLKRYHAQEVDYYNHFVPMVVKTEEGEQAEWEFEDEQAQIEMDAVLEMVLLEQVLARLSSHLDEQDWAVLEGMLACKFQAAIAQGLGITQQAVSKRLGKICRLAREILKESD